MPQINIALVCESIVLGIQNSHENLPGNIYKIFGSVFYTYPLIYLAAKYFRTGLPWKLHQANFKCFTAVHFRVPCKKTDC